MLIRLFETSGKIFANKRRTQHIHGYIVSKEVDWFEFAKDLYDIFANGRRFHDKCNLICNYEFFGSYFDRSISNSRR